MTLRVHFVSFDLLEHEYLWSSSYAYHNTPSCAAKIGILINQACTLQIVGWKWMSIKRILSVSGTQKRIYCSSDDSQKKTICKRWEILFSS
jgi:hypothetical protein